MRSSNAVKVVQFISGFLFLLMGIAIYLLVRGNALPYLPDAWVIQGLLPNSITQLTHQLPTFLHLITFALFTATLLGGGHRSAVWVCLFWLFIEIVFEVAQHPIISSWLVYQIPQWFDNVWLLDNTRSFLTHSTFDQLDIVAAAVAAVFAYVIINFTQAQRIFFKVNASQDVAIALKRSSP